MLLAAVKAVELMEQVNGLATKFHPRLPKVPELLTDTEEFAVKSVRETVKLFKGTVPVTPTKPAAVRTPLLNVVAPFVKLPTFAM
jgi:hypothetical protein